LKEDFNEDPAGACCVVFVEFYALEYVPSNGIRVQEMSKKLADITEAVGIQTVRCVVNVFEDFFKLISVYLVYCAEALCKQTIEFFVCSLLSATVKEHVAQFSFLSGFQLHFHEFVSTFFEVQTRMNREIDCPPQRNEVCFGVIDDFSCFCTFFVVFI